MGQSAVTYSWASSFDNLMHIAQVSSMKVSAEVRKRLFPTEAKAQTENRLLLFKKFGSLHQIYYLL